MILEDCKVIFPMLDPLRPNDRFDPEDPKWELTLITTDTAQRDEWKAAGLRPKLWREKSEDDDGDPILDEEGRKQYRCTVRKRALDKNGNMKEPVTVVDGRRKKLDPKSIGNGSVCNVRVHTYEFTDKMTKEVKKAASLQAVQVIVHKVYTPNFEDFEDVGETEVILPENASSESEEDKPKAPKPKPKPKAAVAEDFEEELDDGEIPF